MQAGEQIHDITTTALPIDGTLLAVGMHRHAFRHDIHRANYLPAPHYFNLNQACAPLAEAFNHQVYLVGSSIEQRDYRDVDVRVILFDEEYERLFPGLSGNPAPHALWSIMCASISLYLAQHSGLPIDFQIQQMTEANAKFGGNHRIPLGLFVHYQSGRPDASFKSE